MSNINIKTTTMAELVEMLNNACADMQGMRVDVERFHKAIWERCGEMIYATGVFQTGSWSIQTI